MARRSVSVLGLGCLLVAARASAATYYVDYANGSDAKDGKTQSTAWQHAPGMNGCTGTCKSTNPQPDDRILLRGGVTWPNSAFSWQPPSAGTSGHPIYYGVDPTWYAGASWTRPVFDLGHAPPSDNLYRIIMAPQSYVTLDNFEITNIACLPSPGNGQTSIFDWGGNTEVGVTVEHMYIHGWTQPYFSVGTGDLTAGSSTITNYIPFSYSTNAPQPSWATSGKVQLQSFGGDIHEGNNTPTVTAISGNNPYTLTFTNTAGPATSSCTGCVVEIGNDFCMISAGVEGPQTDDVMLENVIDGSDTAEVGLNPFGDCGLSEGNNNFCVASGTAEWRQPNIWRDNVIRFVSNGAVGECSEWSGNLLENIRLSTNPTAHTNAIECINDNPVNDISLFYGNVVRHATNPNPSVPGGRWAIGLGDVQPVPIAGETAYIFDNVFFDTLQNAVIERGSSNGKQIVFNNSADCGTSWNLINFCINPIEPSDVIQNNHFITQHTSPIGNCTGYTCTTNLLQTPMTANAEGYSETETYAYAPVAGNASTIGAGTNLSSYCDTLGNAGFTAAAAACRSDTPYAVGYDQTNHMVVVPDRTSVSRPSSGAWDVGAYQCALVDGGCLNTGVGLDGGAGVDAGGGDTGPGSADAGPGRADAGAVYGDGGLAAGDGGPSVAPAGGGEGPSSSSGCSCQVHGTRNPIRAAAWVLGLLGLVWAFARRRASRGGG